MPANRFGALTAVRAAPGEAEGLDAALRAGIAPASLGLFFQDVRTPALASSSSATDFGGLFLALSFFLIVAALLLTALLFVFGVEQRGSEIGVLLALGFRPAFVRRLDEGLELFNLGGADATEEGLARFKAGFGARPLDLEAARFDLATPLRRGLLAARRLLRA